MATVYEVRREGMTLDQICWSVYKTSAGTIEAVYYANPGLSQWNVFLPVGLRITLPDIATAPIQGVVKLWED